MQLIYRGNDMNIAVGWIMMMVYTHSSGMVHYGISMCMKIIMIKNNDDRFFRFSLSTRIIVRNDRT
jgi:hypothetical protein